MRLIYAPGIVYNYNNYIIVNQPRDSVSVLSKPVLSSDLSASRVVAVQICPDV